MNTPGLTRDAALELTVAALGHNDSGDRQIPADDLEVAVLDRTRSQTRKFRRVPAAALTALIGSPADHDEPVAPESGTETGPGSAHSISPGEEPPVAP